MEKDGAAKEQMWPSDRIPMGGLFHTPKVQYSQETADLLKQLMKESHMTMLMRKNIESSLRSGAPLPKPEPPIDTKADPDANALEILRRARNAKRKSLAAILNSGAYEKPCYRPRPDGRMPSDKAKKQLQEIMAGMRLSDTTLKPKRRPRAEQDSACESEDIINELLQQINERAEWLAEMEELGEGHKHRNDIRSQIAERLRHIKGLETKIALKKQGVRYIE